MYHNHTKVSYHPVWHFDHAILYFYLKLTHLSLYQHETKVFFSTSTGKSGGVCIGFIDVNFLVHTKEDKCACIFLLNLFQYVNVAVFAQLVT